MLAIDRYANILSIPLMIVKGAGETVFLRIIAGILLGIWLLLVLLGKGGFIHILLLNGVGVAVVDIVCVYRGQVTR